MIFCFAQMFYLRTLAKEFSLRETSVFHQKNILANFRTFQKCKSSDKDLTTKQFFARFKVRKNAQSPPHVTQIGNLVIPSWNLVTPVWESRDSRWRSRDPKLQSHGHLFHQFLASIGKTADLSFAKKWLVSHFCQFFGHILAHIFRRATFLR